MLALRGFRTALGLAVATLLSAGLVGANDCCPNGTVFVKNSKGCAHLDGGGADYIQRNINCTMGMYLLDPSRDQDDEFVVTADGHLQIGGNDSFYVVPPHMFCITSVQVEKNAPIKPHKVAFICFPGEVEESSGREQSVRIFYGILQAISTVFLFVTLAIYVLIPELRDLQGKCIMSTVLCQHLGYLFLVGIQFKGHVMKETPCIVSAFILYFWMLASFFWLSVASFNVWRTVRYQRFPLNDHQLFWCYCLFGWLCPFVFLVAALATHHMPVTEDVLLRPNFGLTRCWFDGDRETWVYFYGPISVLLACNIAFFLMTALRLWRRGECENTLPGLKASRFKCILYLKIFVIMGILWIFEVISFLLKGYTGFWHIPDALNSLQGVFIFLVVACRRRVVNAVAKREWGQSLVSTLCPRWCTGGPDAEQEEAMLASAGDDETYVPMDTAARADT